MACAGAQLSNGGVAGDTRSAVAGIHGGLAIKPDDAAQDKAHRYCQSNATRIPVMNARITMIIRSAGALLERSPVR